MVVHQSHARADLAVPADEGAPVPDEAAGLDFGPDRMAHQGQVVVSPEQADDGVPGQVVDVEARQADLRLPRRGGEGLERQGQAADHLLFHRRVVGKDVAHRDVPGADGFDQAVEVPEVPDVLLHDDEGDADVDPVRALAVHLLQALQALHIRPEARALADVLEALRGDAVEGNPERIETARHEPPEHSLVEARAVRDHLGPDAERLDGRDHAEDCRMDRRLAEAAEHRGFEVGEPPELGDETVEDLREHVAHRLLPGVPDAGFAGQVAARGRFDVDPAQAVDVGADLDPAVGDECDLGPGFEAELPGEFRRDGQPAVAADPGSKAFFALPKVEPVRVEVGPFP